MIINLEREPLFSLYYLGGIVLKILHSKNYMQIEDLFKLTKKELNYDLHIDFFYYTMDWLYLLSAVKIKKGMVLLCE